MHFGENQLSPRSIGISPLPTAHPSILQHTPVRASTGSYTRFNLAMGRSRSFGSTDEQLTRRPIQTRFRSASVSETLNLATDSNSPVHSAKGTPSPGTEAMVL